MDVEKHAPPAEETGLVVSESRGGEAVREQTDATHSDVGWDLYTESLQMDPSERESIALRVKRKLDFILLPMMCFIYFLSFLDKQTLNYGNAYGLQKDLGLVGRDYSWVAAITNIGYLCFTYPSVTCLHKLPIGKIISVALLLWGTLLMCTTAASNFAGIMTLRFLLGGAEACITPAWLLLSGMFWTREEQPFRMAWWLGCNGLSTMAGAGLAWGFGHTSGELAPWQLIFLVVGVISFVTGIVAFFTVPSTPNDWVFFSHEERVVAVWRVSHNRTGVKHTKILWHQLREAQLDPKVYLIGLLAFCLGMLNASVTNFISALLLGFGFDSLRTVLYQLPGGAMQFSCTIVAGYLNSKFSGFLCISIIIGLIPGLAGMIGIAMIPLTHQIALAACAWLQGIFGLSIILTGSIVTADIAGHSKRTFVNGVMFVSYAGGQIVGPFLFIPEEAPRYLSAIKALAGIYGSSMFFAAALGVWMWRQNQLRRDELALENLGDEEGFADRTDIENRAFIYKF